MSIKGRDIIIYILENHMEDSEIDFSGFFMDVDEAAVKLGVGQTTVKSYYMLGLLKGVEIGGNLYFPKDSKIGGN
jgi:hypothetical protein